MSRTVVGIDIGGTFTDFVLVQAGKIAVHKRLSTPDDPARAVLEGLTELEVGQAADVVHGSTIATNALLERRGARTVLITTAGFRDVLEIGRQNRPDLYALAPRKPSPLIPRDLRLEVSERVDADGRASVALTQGEVARILAAVREAAPESIAICLINSFLNDQHERMLSQALQDCSHVTVSSSILPEHREYERSSTTVINAYVAPLVDRYLARLESGLEGRRLRIMQSNGGVITARAARREAARVVLSGPAAGAVGAYHVATLAGFERSISFDMGGTSTDVAVFPGKILYTREAQIANMPLRLPVVDLHTVGAGGGSLARVDSGGALQVGPQSAGADPGPACYGRGNQPTTTDANLVLGRLHPEYFLGGGMRLDVERARAALASLATQMQADSVEAAAWGVIQVANAAMERAIRTVSVERGYDPRDFSLVPFGGAGPLHACALAEALGISKILVPAVPGVLSALGMTAADLVKDYSLAVHAGTEMLADLDGVFAPLERRAHADLLADGVESRHIRLERILEMRYAGQSHEIAVAEPEHGDWGLGFHAAHERLYGHRHDRAPVEIVNARLRAVGQSAKPDLTLLQRVGDSAGAARLGSAKVWFAPDKPLDTELYSRDCLRPGDALKGPAVVFQFDSTTLIAPGWAAQVDTWGNIVLTYAKA